jgi:hypothetical protein
MLARGGANTFSQFFKMAQRGQGALTRIKGRMPAKCFLSREFLTESLVRQFA